jgi:hypothetical protein
MNDKNDLFKLDFVADLPAELVKGLRATKRDMLEVRLIELFQISGRPLNLDEVLVGFYRKFNEVLDRRTVINKLYAMSKSASPAIEAVADKKGVYVIRNGFAHIEAGSESTTPVEEELSP